MVGLIRPERDIEKITEAAQHASESLNPEGLSLNPYPKGPRYCYGTYFPK